MAKEKEYLIVWAMHVAVNILWSYGQPTNKYSGCPLWLIRRYLSFLLTQCLQTQMASSIAKKCSLLTCTGLCFYLYAVLLQTTLDVSAQIES